MGIENGNPFFGANYRRYGSGVEGIGNFLPEKGLLVLVWRWMLLGGVSSTRFPRPGIPVVQSFPFYLRISLGRLLAFSDDSSSGLAPFSSPLPGKVFIALPGLANMPAAVVFVLTGICALPSPPGVDAAVPGSFIFQLSS